MEDFLKKKYQPTKEIYQDSYASEVARTKNLTKVGQNNLCPYQRWL